MTFFCSAPLTRCFLTHARAEASSGISEEREQQGARGTSMGSQHAKQDKLLTEATPFSRAEIRHIRHIFKKVTGHKYGQELDLAAFQEVRTILSATRFKLVPKFFFWLNFLHPFFCEGMAALHWDGEHARRD